MARPIRRPESPFPQARLVVPADVRATLGRTEFKQSLRTVDRAEACRLQAELVAGWRRQIEAARAEARGDLRTLTLREVDALCGRWYAEEVARWGDNAGTREHWAQERDQLSDMFFPETDDDGQPSGVRVFDPDSRTLSSTATRLRGEGIAADPVSVRMVAERWAMTRWRLSALMLRRLGGDWTDPELATFPAPVDIQRAGRSVDRTPRLTIRGLLDAWAAERKPAASTLKAYGIVIRQLERIAGHDDAGRVDVDMVRRFKEARAAEGVIEKTVINAILAGGAVWQWGVLNGLVKENPFARRAPRRSRQVDPPRVPFTDEEARRILEAARSEGGWRRWVPWVLCFTGGRIEDIADLQRQDVRREAGVWILDIVATQARRGKTSSSQRMIPLHPALIDEGFLAYVETLPEGGPLWPDCTVGRGTGGRAETMQTNHRRWVRLRVGITNPRKAPAHSWRHWLKDKLRVARVDPAIEDAILGHDNRRNAGDGYGRGFRRMPEETIKELEKVPSPLALQALA